MLDDYIDPNDRKDKAPDRKSVMLAPEVHQEIQDLAYEYGISAQAVIKALLRSFREHEQNDKPTRKKRAAR